MFWIYSIVLYIAAAFIIGCYVYSVRHSVHSPIEKPVRRLLLCASSVLIAHATALLMRDQTAATAVYGLYNCFIDITTISLMSYIRQYTGINRISRYEKIIVAGIAAADSILLLANPFLRWEFICQQHWDRFGAYFYRITERKIPYIFHLGFIYVCMMIIFSVLIRKTYESPRTYKMKYAGVIIGLGMFIAAHAAYLKFDFIFDYSLLFYSAVAFSIFYFSLIYVPRGLMERLLFFTVANMKDGIICLDVEGKCIHANKPAKIYCDAEIESQNLDQQVSKWFEEQIGRTVKDKEWESERRIDGVIRNYTIEYKRIFDQQMKYLGCFFVMKDRTDEYTRIEAEKYRATHDALTGIYNKDYFYETSKQRILENPDTKYYIVCTDVKNFKIVNDVFGVEEGDRLLKYIAEVTASFGGEDCVYGRISGDRFGICIPEYKFKEEEILKKYAGVSRFMNHEAFRTHIHIGVYEVTDASLRISVMCDRANMAIKTIKDSYEDVVAYYDRTFRDMFINEQKVISEFEIAIKTNQFHAFIQPQISVDGYVKGGEALVRWIHPTDGMIPPYKFIGILEQTGLISRLDSYMWEQACIKLREWHDSGIESSYISVNISQKDFYLLDVYEVITSLVKKYELSPECLHLEITETAIMNNPSTQLPLLGKLREFGFIIEIDDFGSGYSSLNTLKDLIADVLKIDMGFLEKTRHSERSKRILQMIIALAKSLDMEVITEGVETREQVDFLARFGCDMYQGYYFAKPVSVSEFEEKFLDTHIEI